ncbi:MAG TPA: hypothetical protein VGB42_09590 [Candidatus Thermoplasmatota archaeon]
MDEPWQIYYEELLERAEDVPDQRWNREEDVEEAAHEAYQSTVDRLVNQLDYDDGEAVGLGKEFGRAVKEWLREGSFDFDDLADKLEARQAAWEEKELTSF